MTSVDIGIPVVDRILPGTHLCALYSGSAERDDILFPFLREGLRRGDTCLCFVDGLEPDAVRARTEGAAAPSAHRFDVRPASEVYLQPDGTFSVEHMTSVLSDSLDEVAADGPGLLRATGEMPWPGVQLHPRGVDDFFVYEAALAPPRGRGRGPEPAPAQVVENQDPRGEHDEPLLRGVRPDTLAAAGCVHDNDTDPAPVCLRAPRQLLRDQAAALSPPGRRPS